MRISNLLASFAAYAAAVISASVVALSVLAPAATAGTAGTAGTPTTAVTAARDTAVPDARFLGRAVCVHITTAVAPATWQVLWAVREWNKSQSHVRFTVRASCATSAQAVTVSGYQGTSGGGWTQAINPRWDGNSWIYGRVSVNLNMNTPGGSACYRRTVITHELGHSLGLPHLYDLNVKPVGTNATTSIMGSSYNIDRYCGKVGKFDLRYLDHLYR